MVNDPLAVALTEIYMNQPPAIRLQEPQIEYQKNPNESKHICEQKRLRRHENLQGRLKKDPMYIMPLNQLEGEPNAHESDRVNFVMFDGTFRQSKSISRKDKKQLTASIRDDPDRVNMTNLKLPSLNDPKVQRFRPGNSSFTFEKSGSLNFTVENKRKADR